jgi:hypothetical protein
LSEAYDDYQDRLEAARLRSLIAATGVRVCELAVLLSAFEAIAHSARLREAGDVPNEELSGVPDPSALLAEEDEMTTGEAMRILRGFLGMSEEGETRLQSMLDLDI